MTIDQLKERIEAQCMKHGFNTNGIAIECEDDDKIFCDLFIGNEYFLFCMPSTELLLDKIDLECRVIKHKQSSASNGIDE